MYSDITKYSIYVEDGYYKKLRIKHSIIKTCEQIKKTAMIDDTVKFGGTTRLTQWERESTKLRAGQGNKV